jgi:nitrite reductase (NO-forming)
MLKQLAIIVGVALTTACGAATGSTRDVQTGGQQVTLTVGNSMQFVPGSIVVRAGEPVELALRNGGGILHDFSLTEATASPVKIEAQGGQTARAVFTIDTPGSFEFVCSVPGHAAAGMRGTLTASTRST